jgi:hypothetical protein
MDLTGILIVVGVSALLLLGIGFGIWSAVERRKVRVFWKQYAKEKGGKYKGGFISHPMLEFEMGGAQVRLILAKYRRNPDRTVVHFAIASLPGDVAIGRIGAAHGIGRMIAGQKGGHSAPLDSVLPGWTVRGEDRVFVQKCASNGPLQVELSRLVAMDPQAVVEWANIKYSVEEYTKNEDELDALLRPGAGVAGMLAAMCEMHAQGRL